MAGRRAKSNAKRPGQWTVRKVGLVVCAFFGLGVLAGLSPTGRLAARRAANSVSLARRLLAQIVPALYQQPRPAPASRADAPGAAAALVERGDGLYLLDQEGGLSGPLSAGAPQSLPVLSGPAVRTASSRALLEYAAVAVRMEAALATAVSETEVKDDGRMELFLERYPLELVIDRHPATVEFERAGWLWRRWQGRHRLIASIDLTPAGQAVVRLRREAVGPAVEAGAARRPARLARASAGRVP